MTTASLGTARVLLPDGPMRPPVRQRLLEQCARAELGLVVDLPALEQRYAETVAAARAHDIRLLCAVKASSREEVLSRAAASGLGFDVANARELARARAVAPDASVSLTTPALPIAERDDLYAAFAAGQIHRWHSDSLDQLDELARACPGSTVGIRVNLDGQAIPDGVSVYRPSRFGIRLDQLPLARQIAERHGCRLGWLHVHTESEVYTLEGYAYATERILAAAADCGVLVESLDLGGGLEPDIDDLGKFFGMIRTVAGPDVEVVLEPGRYWLTDCISLVTQVLAVKQTAAYAFLTLDYALLTHLQWADGLRIPVLGPLDPDDPRTWRICGRSCDEEDVLADQTVPVAPEGPVPQVGDFVVLGNVTGYCIELGCDFNGIRRPTVHFVES
jgi:diaminopimelate decarboxylase